MNTGTAFSGSDRVQKLALKLDARSLRAITS